MPLEMLRARVGDGGLRCVAPVLPGELAAAEYLTEGQYRGTAGPITSDDRKQRSTSLRRREKR